MEVSQIDRATKHALYQPYVRRSRNDRLGGEKTGQGVKDRETNMLHTLSLTSVSYKIYESEREKCNGGEKKSGPIYLY
jgi:hypothetical protein